MVLMAELAHRVCTYVHVYMVCVCTKTVIKLFSNHIETGLKVQMNTQYSMLFLLSWKPFTVIKQRNASCEMCQPQTQ